MIKLTVITIASIYLFYVLSIVIYGLIDLETIPGLGNFWQYGALGGIVIVLIYFVFAIGRFANKRFQISDRQIQKKDEHAAEREKIHDQQIERFTDTVNRFIVNETKQSAQMEKQSDILEKQANVLQQQSRMMEKLTEKINTFIE